MHGIWLSSWSATHKGVENGSYASKSFKLIVVSVMNKKEEPCY